MNRRWITGKRIINRWGALEFELLQAIDDGLCPYHPKTGKRLTRIAGRLTGENEKPEENKTERPRQENTRHSDSTEKDPSPSDAHPDNTKKRIQEILRTKAINARILAG